MFWKTRKQNRKWQRRPNLYQGQHQWVRRLSQVALVLFVLTTIVSAAVYFSRSDAFTIRKILVTGDLEHVIPETVITLSGLTAGEKLFTTTLGRLKHNIMRFSWIAQVDLRRQFPDTLQIHITERKPHALLLLDQLYLIDSSGRVFKKREPGDPQDLPVISGLTEDFAKGFPALAKADFEMSLSFLTFLNEQPFYQNDPVSEVHFDAVFGFSVYTKKWGTEIYYGNSDFAAKQECLEKFKLSKQYREQALVRLDLDRPGFVIARPL